MVRRATYVGTKTDLASLSDVLWYAYQRNGDFIHVFRSGGKVHRYFNDGMVPYSCTVQQALRGPIVGDKEHNLVRVGSDLYRMDQACTGRRELIAAVIPSALQLYGSRACWFELRNKIAYIDYMGIVYVYTISGTSITGPVNAGYVDGVTTSGWSLLFPYRRDLLCAYNVNNGRILVIRSPELLAGDAAGAVIASTSVVAGLSYVCWSQWNEVFWGVVTGTCKSRLWADIVQPTTVSSVELLDTSPPLHPLVGTRIRARVTSTVSGHPTLAYEVVEGWFVNWNLVGPGFLEKVQSTTDMYGYAYNYYFGPISNAGLPLVALIVASIRD